jgi:allantoinase
LIAESKAAGQAVTVETCAHYLALTDEDLLRLGPVAKCAPPLRDRAEQDRLWRDVLAGQIDCVTSDHSPCPTDDKTRGDDDIWQAWGGITGVQTLVPVMLTEGVHRRSMPWSTFGTLLSATPAKIAGLWPRKGAIQVGADADLLIVDPELEWTVDRSWLQSRHKHSPFIGRTMKGWVDQVIRRGQTIAENGEVTVDRGGAWLRPHSGAKTPL